MSGASKGKLKLKGDLTVKGGKIVKAKKRKKKSISDSDDHNFSVQVLETADGYVLPQPGGDEDRRTAAEKRFDERVIKRETQAVKTQALKSHREKVKEFNEYLAKLTEHHDIPKVGPG